MADKEIKIISSNIQDGISKLNALSQNYAIAGKVTQIDELLDNNSGETVDMLKSVNAQLISIENSMSSLISTTIEMLNVINSNFATADENAIS